MAPSGAFLGDARRGRAARTARHRQRRCATARGSGSTRARARCSAASPCRRSCRTPDHDGAEAGTGRRDSARPLGLRPAAARRPRWSSRAATVSSCARTRRPTRLAAVSCWIPQPPRGGIRTALGQGPLRRTRPARSRPRRRRHRARRAAARRTRPATLGLPRAALTARLGLLDRRRAGAGGATARARRPCRGGRASSSRRSQLEDIGRRVLELAEAYHRSIRSEDGIPREEARVRAAAARHPACSSA